MECPSPYKLSDFTAHSSLPLQDRDALEELITGWTSPIPSRTSWAGLVIIAGACLSLRAVLGIWVWTASNRWPGRWLGSRTFICLMKALTKNADGQGFFTSCGVSNSVITEQWRLHISNAHLRHLGSAHLQLRRNLTIFKLKVLKLVMKRWTGARPEVSTRNARIARRVVAWYPLFHELKKRALWAQEHGHPQHWFRTEQTFMYSGRLSGPDARVNPRKYAPRLGANWRQVVMQRTRRSITTAAYSIAGRHTSCRNPRFYWTTCRAVHNKANLPILIPVFIRYRTSRSGLEGAGKRGEEEAGGKGGWRGEGKWARGGSSLEGAGGSEGLYVFFCAASHVAVHISHTGKVSIRVIASIMLCETWLHNDTFSTSSFAKKILLFVVL